MENFAEREREIERGMDGFLIIWLHIIDRAPTTYREHQSFLFSSLVVKFLKKIKLSELSKHFNAQPTISEFGVAAPGRVDPDPTFELKLYPTLKKNRIRICNHGFNALFNS